MGLGYIDIILSWTSSEGRIVAWTEVGQVWEPEQKHWLRRITTSMDS